MLAILNYFQFIIKKIVSLLNVQFFEDFPVTFLELILIVAILRYVFKFVFGGFKEVETSTDWMSRSITSKSMENISRQVQISSEKAKIRKTVYRLDKMHLVDLADDLRNSYYSKYGERI